ncbi:MAG: ABC transporter substrate-binding protein [Azospirillaceae bacterium]
MKIVPIGTVRRLAMAAAAGLALSLALPASQAQAQEGELVVALPTFSDETMVPWAGSGQRKTYLDLVYEYLVYLDPETGEPLPGLAESWEMSEDGTVWTFHLREGVPFTGGHGVMTSADVAYSIQRLIGEDSRAGPASTMRRTIASVETPDERTVVVNLNFPDFELAQGYFGVSQQLGIVSRDYVESLGDQAATAPPVGTGPYVLESQEAGSSITMTLRDDIDIADHWRVTPDFETVTFRLAPEEATRVAMLQTGEADIAPVGFDSLPTLEDAGIRIVSAEATWSPVIRLGGLVMNDPARHNPDAPWADQRVRQAMNYAVDKQTIIDELFHGEAVVAASDTPVRAWESVEPYPYDPDRARELLAEAGYPDGFDITLRTFTTTPGAELPLMAEAVALYWQDVGINATIEPVDWPAMRSDWTEGRATEVVWSHRGFPFASAANGLEAGFVSDSLFASFASDELDAMIDDFVNEQDLAAREQKLTAIGQYLRDQAAAVFIALANEPYGVGPDVGEWPLNIAYVWNFDQVRHAE